MKILAIFLAFLAFATPVFADNGYAVQVRERQIELPGVSGYTQVYGQSAEMDELFEKFVPQSNRLLAVYLLDEDLERLKSEQEGGEESAFKQYILVQTSRQDLDVSGDTRFEAFKKAYLDEMRGLALSNTIDRAQEVLQDATAYLKENRQMDLSIKVGEARNLGVFLDAPDAIGLLMIMNYGVTDAKGDIRSTPVAMASSVIRVGSVPLFVYAYRTPADKIEDAVQVKEVTENFARDLLAGEGISLESWQAEPIYPRKSMWDRIVIGMIVGAIAGVAILLCRQRRKNLS